MISLMVWNPDTYQNIESPVHRMDARIKIGLLLAYSICLFFADTWQGLAVFAALFAGGFKVSRLPLKPLLAMLVPLYIILIFTWAFNAFALSADAGVRTFGYGVSSAVVGGLSDVPALSVVGGLYFVPGGAMVGCFVVLRIFFLTMASFLVSCTTPSLRLADAVASVLRPLGRVGFPVDDAALVLSLALRFIPLLGEEAQVVALAQKSRGARFEGSGLWRSLTAWGAVFVPLFVGLFRRAQRLGAALDARCYGAVPQRTVLHPFRATRCDWVCLLFGLTVCIVCAVLW